ncbi:WecB/TagA/CpsF family glycosyltransferase [Methylotuvimicrobium sp. KM1]|uniref:WecB/TagA/CpsF family glycosyltransferase n=1 Tax=Methylotuvimicrobium sp. KM1 TaxID=3377707 RepID=UPI003850BCFE
MVDRVEVLGVPVDCVDMQGALDAVDVMINSGKPNTIIALNPEKVIKAQSDSKLLGWLRNASLIIPDGIGVVVAARKLNQVNISRVPGSELMPKICERSVSKGYKLFLYGASQETIQKAVDRLTERYPGIQIVGFQNGYLPEEQMPDLINLINQSQAQILFVALGSPRQELWMDNYLGKLHNIRVCQGVGGTFDVIAGTVKRAPKFFIDIHCEWLYRLLSQPSRLIRQTALPIFAFKVLMAWLKK